MRYGSTDVLKGVDLRVEPGEVLALLGPNGAGKTTMIEILAGFRRRSAGQVRVLGMDPDDGGEHWRARIGIVLQSWGDHRRWRVRDLLENIGRFYEPYAGADRKRPYDTDMLLARVGLTEQASKVISKLSGGQRRRLDVAIGLVGNPELLFLDEPTMGFDPQARLDFHTLIQKLSRNDGTSIVLTTHDLQEAEKLAQKIAILISGRIVAYGSARELSVKFPKKANIRFTLNGEQHSYDVVDTTDFVKKLLNRHGASVSALEVRSASLEDTYLGMVGDFESARNIRRDELVPGDTR
ncbi:ABC transporter ATP-binding protein [Nocardia transvalensis]|uniref:ABC transporter ATP-binding protein n=1 Tax=Nocardia transvalensis TaxID=37333 RepID=UPI001E5685BD|nr:ABC transporter ATP-binding protein [Nocardia transvalensis]